jgi:uncharacterized OB-fold protein
VSRVPFHERIQNASRLRHWPVTIEATYLYTAGVAGERFFGELKKSGKILATECAGCGVEYLPPRVYCERCFGDIGGSWHAVAPTGVVESFTVLRRALDGSQMDPPEVRAVVRMGRGQGALIHRLLVPPEDAFVGMQVKAKLKPRAKRNGDILDIEGFVRK